MLPLFFTIGIIFAPIGGLLLYASAKVQELSIDYSHCSDTATGNFTKIDNQYVTSAFKTTNPNIDAEWMVEKGVSVTIDTGATVKTNVCHLRFNIPEEMGAPVLFYYHLTNFHQNHRRYVDSFDPDQLKGSARSYDAIAGSKCTPLYGDKNSNKPYYPCGLIANSMFNDTFTNPMWLNPPSTPDNKELTVPYVMSNNSNIAWASDQALYGPTGYKPSDCIPPPNWKERYPNGYTDQSPPPDLKNWQAFQVWMRTAGLPNFSKLYQRNDTAALQAGRYEVVINDCTFTHLFPSSLCSPANIL